MAYFERTKAVKNHVDHASSHQKLVVTPQEDYFGDHYVESAEYQWKRMKRDEVGIEHAILPGVSDREVFTHLRSCVYPKGDCNNYVEGVC